MESAKNSLRGETRRAGGGTRVSGVRREAEEDGERENLGGVWARAFSVAPASRSFPWDPPVEAELWKAQMRAQLGDPASSFGPVRVPEIISAFHMI